MKINEFALYEKLLEAYETSTLSFNRFQKAINSIKWDEIFKTSDESIMYTLGRFSLEVFNDDGHPNPFTQWMHPTVMFSDNSIIAF